MAKIKLIDIGMDDPMERLYYERQACRMKSYAAKHRRTLMKGRRKSVNFCKSDGCGFSQASSAAI